MLIYFAWNVWGTWTSGFSIVSTLRIQTFAVKMWFPLLYRYSMTAPRDFTHISKERRKKQNVHEQKQWIV
jgi:hypothetical protein